MIMRKSALLTLTALLCAPVAMTAETGKTASREAEASPAQAPLMAHRQNSSFLVGQVYAGGNVGFAIPMGIGRSGDELAFNDVAKTGFAIYADVMRQMNQAIGLGGEVGYRKYGYNDKKTWGSLTRYGAFDASYQAVDFNLTGRLFLGRQSIRPFIGVLVGGELIMNSVDFTPSKQYQNIPATNYKTTNMSVAYGVMSGAYFKAGRRTLLSLQVRLNFVPTLDDGTIEVSQPNGDTQFIAQNQHGNQTNLTVTLGMHIGTQKNNKH